MITIGIVDDKLINRKTIRKKFTDQPGFTVVLEAVNGGDFIEKMEGLNPTELPMLILMDIDMPVMNGIDAIAVASIKYPATRFLVLTVFDDDEKIFEAIQAGASGYLLKDDSTLELTEAVKQALEFNGAPMSPAIARKTLNWLKEMPRKHFTDLPEEIQILSEREMEIIKLMVNGCDYKMIAARLFISPHTVRTHISKIYEKLHINSKSQAMQLAYKYKWVK